MIALATCFVSLGWALLLASVGLGIEHGEMSVGTPGQRAEATQLGRAADLGFAFFLAAEIAFGVTAGALGLVRFQHLHWTVAAATIALASIAVSYGLLLTSSFLGGAPDPIESVAVMLSDWLRAVARI